MRSIVAATVLGAVLGGCLGGPDGEKGIGLASESTCPAECLDDDRLETCMTDGSRFVVSCRDTGEGFVCNPAGARTDPDGTVVADCGPPRLVEEEPVPEEPVTDETDTEVEDTCNRCIDGWSSAHVCVEGAEWVEECWDGVCVEDQYGAYCDDSEGSDEGEGGEGEGEWEGGEGEGEGEDEWPGDGEETGCGTCLDEWTSRECSDYGVTDIDCWAEYGGWCEDGYCVW